VRAVLRLGALVAALAVLCACTSSGGTPSTPAPSVQTKTVVHTRTPSAGPTAPVSTGPTTAAKITTCPLLAQSTAADRLGMRLDKITALRSDGRVVGCRFYALQHPNASCSESCLQGEHLPPAKQPAVEIITARYPSITAAHNAFVLLGEKGHNVQQDDILGQAPGLCFQTDFYPKDKGTDWACAFNKGARLIVVRTVVTSPALSAIQVARAVAKNV
jgi:hypothetical protein